MLDDIRKHLPTSDEEFIRFRQELLSKLWSNSPQHPVQAREIVTQVPTKSPRNLRQHPKQVARMQSDKPHKMV